MEDAEQEQGSECTNRPPRASKLEDEPAVTANGCAALHFRCDRSKSEEVNKTGGFAEGG